MNIIATMYLTGRIDPQRFFYVLPNDFDYIKNWYESICDNQLKGVIFHDSLSNEFINQYQNEYIHFVSVGDKYLRSGYTVCDYRWYAMLDFINNHDFIENVFMTDGNDVEILNDPFEFINNENIYVGREYGGEGNGVLISQNNWMKQVISYCNFNNFDYYDKVTLNAGIVGGCRKIMLEFLQEMTRITTEINPTDDYFDKNFPDANPRVIDMAVFNKVIYSKFGKNYITGYPLHNKYKFDDKSTDIYIRHK